MNKKVAAVAANKAELVKNPQHRWSQDSDGSWTWRCRCCGLSRRTRQDSCGRHYYEFRASKDATDSGWSEQLPACTSLN